MWYDYGIYVDANFVLSRGKNKISPEIYEKVLELRRYFEAMEDYLHIYETPENPTGVYKRVQQIARDNGTIHYKEVPIKDGETTRMVKMFDRYEPHNPLKFIFLMIDHIGLAKTEAGKGDTKQVIDAISQDMVQARNNYGMTPIIIQQLAFAMEAPERFQQKRLTPQLSDFSDSKYTTRDANVVLSLFNPMNYKLAEFNGYNTQKLGNNFRNLEILVNRDGDSFVNTGLLYYSKIGSFRELPRSSDTDGMKKVYEHLSKL